MTNNYLEDASLRSSAEPSAQVVNGQAAQKQYNQSNGGKSLRKKPHRKPFVEVKTKAFKLYDSLKWLLDDQFDEDKLLRKCLVKVINETTGYSETAFKKDLAMKMSHLLNDRKYQRKCWYAGWDLFEEAQKCCWAKESVFQQIRDMGIDMVPGFKTPDIVIYTKDDLINELLALGFDNNYFEDNPYSKEYKVKHSDQTGPRM